MLSERLSRIVNAIVEKTDAAATISIDALGEAIGLEVASAADVDEMITLLEKSGLHVDARGGARGENNLRIVLAEARAIARETGARATVSFIAERTGLSIEEVNHALALAKVMQR
jgi:hypothetical protein